MIACMEIVGFSTSNKVKNHLKERPATKMTVWAFSRWAGPALFFLFIEEATSVNYTFIFYKLYLFVIYFDQCVFIACLYVHDPHSCIIAVVSSLLIDNFSE